MTSPIAFHIDMHLEGRRVIAMGAPALRSASRAIVEQGRARGLIAFRVADTHLHALLRCARDVAGLFVRSVACALKWRLGLTSAFEPAHFEAVYTQSHFNRAFFYVLRQETRHGTSFDPLHEGSSLPDTLGLRVIDTELPRRVAAALPRLRRTELVELFGPAGETIRVIRPDPPLDRLADAAAAALALSDLHGRAPATVRARCAAQHLARRQQLSNTDIAALLDVTPRCVQMLANSVVRESDLAAIRAQLWLREASPTLPRRVDAISR